MAVESRMKRRRLGLLQRGIVAALVAGIIGTNAIPQVASAQRIAPSGAVPMQRVRPFVLTVASVGWHFGAIRHDTASTVSGSSQAVAIGALAGAILGASFAYSLGASDCDGSAGTQERCRRTLLIGGTAVGAGIGAIIGHIIQLGNEHDARRARAVADSTAAARQQSARPSI